MRSSSNRCCLASCVSAEALASLHRPKYNDSWVVLTVRKLHWQPATLLRVLLTTKSLYSKEFLYKTRCTKNKILSCFALLKHDQKVRGERGLCCRWFWEVAGNIACTCSKYLFLNLINESTFHAKDFSATVADQVAKQQVRESLLTGNVDWALWYAGQVNWYMVVVCVYMHVCVCVCVY